MLPAGALHAFHAPQVYFAHPVELGAAQAQVLLHVGREGVGLFRNFGVKGFLPGLGGGFGVGYYHFGLGLDVGRVVGLYFGFDGGGGLGQRRWGASRRQQQQDRQGFHLQIRCGVKNTGNGNRPAGRLRQPQEGAAGGWFTK